MRPTSDGGGSDSGGGCDNPCGADCCSVGQACIDEGCCEASLACGSACCGGGRCGRTASTTHRLGVPMQPAVRHQNWKLIKSGKSRWLFDLSTDAGEKKNVINANPEKRKLLERLLDQWQSEMSPPAWPSKPQRRKVSIDGQPYEINI